MSVPRDRAGTFDPKLIAKYQRRFPDFDEKIVSMYARGMTVREIRGHLEELYGIDVSPDLISAVTDAVLDEVAEWQNRPLDICYPLVFFDAIEMHAHKRFTVATNVQVYFCDPRSPWQRGSTRTPTACCVSTSREEPTSRASLRVI